MFFNKDHKDFNSMPTSLIASERQRGGGGGGGGKGAGMADESNTWMMEGGKAALPLL